MAIVSTHKHAMTQSDGTAITLHCTAWHTTIQQAQNNPPLMTVINVTLGISDHFLSFACKRPAGVWANHVMPQVPNSSDFFMGINAAVHMNLLTYELINK